MAKNDLVQDLDDIDFDSKEDLDELEDFDDVSDEELQEIEEIVEKKPKVKSKKKPKTKKKVEPKAKPKPKKKANTARPSKKTNSNVKNKGIFYAIVFVVMVAVILAIGFTNNWFTQSQNDGSEPVAYVNGEIITEGYLDMKYQQLSATSTLPVNKEAVLERLIDQVLIQQKAKELGIEVTLDEAEMKLNELLVAQQLTKEQFEQNINSVGVTMDDVLEDMKQYLLMEKLAAETFEKDIEITNAELLSYFSDKAIVRHILLLSQEADDGILGELEDVKEILEDNDSLFCEFVTNMSEDPGSINTCGRYMFAQGQMVEEFENASFALQPGDMTIIKTVYGYHLIQRLSIDDEATAQAEAAIKESKYNVAYENFILGLRDESEIEIVGDDADSQPELDDIVIELDNSDDVTIDNSTEINDTTTENNAEEEDVVASNNNEDEDVTATDSDQTIETDNTDSDVSEDEDVTETDSEEVDESLPTVKYFYSESDATSQAIYQTLKDLELDNYINVEWRCIRVAVEDKELCIESYGLDAYNTAMTEAADLGLVYAPTIMVDSVEYVGDYTSEAVEDFICDIADC